LSALLYGKTPHGFAKFKIQSRITQKGCALLGNNVEIGGQKQVLVAPEKLPDQTLEMVSHNSIPHLAADGDTDTRSGTGSFLPEYDETVGMKLSALPGKLQEFGPFQKALVPGKTARRSGHYFAAMVTANLLRPLARRRLITRRPFFVDMRTRKPWVLFREVLLG
jgi:hypothetical protein